MLGKIVLSSFISLLSLNLYAATLEQVIVAPTCLSKKLTVPYKTLASENNFVLLQTNNRGLEQLIAAKKPNKLCGGFMNVTTSWQQFNSTLKTEKEAKTFLARYTMTQSSKKLSAKASYSIKHEKEVNQLLKLLNSQNIWDNLTTLSNFPDRYANSDNGVKASEWVINQMKKIAGDRKDVSIYSIKTGTDYAQPSVVAKFGTGNEPGIVIGGHIDTTYRYFYNKPGADDDGSGSVTVLEVARTLLQSGMHFKKPIYFIWYAAEEQGEVGSQIVVEEFKNKNIPVSAVLQLDMTGYAYENDPTLWLMTDYVDDDLTNYLKQLISTYVKKPVGESSCGYACSDHASWNQEGIPAVMPFESTFEHMNPAYHSSEDTIDKLTLSHMHDFAKLGVAFAVELAEPVT